MTQVQENIRLAQRNILEDDIRGLEHYLAFGYFQHPETKASMKRLVAHLQEELAAL